MDVTFRYTPLLLLRIVSVLALQFETVKGKPFYRNPSVSTRDTGLAWYRSTILLNEGIKKFTPETKELENPTYQMHIS